MTDHATHGQESTDDWPNATHCPCFGIASLSAQDECAAAGCRYCRLPFRVSGGVTVVRHDPGWEPPEGVILIELSTGTKDK
jgi:hypothetical protein